MDLTKQDIEILVTLINESTIKGNSAAVIAALLGKLEVMHARASHPLPSLNGNDASLPTATDQGQ